MSTTGIGRPGRPVGNHFRCWWLTGSAAAPPVVLTLTHMRHSPEREIVGPSLSVIPPHNDLWTTTQTEAHWHEATTNLVTDAGLRTILVATLEILTLADL